MKNHPLLQAGIGSGNDRLDSSNFNPIQSWNFGALEPQVREVREICELYQHLRVRGWSSGTRTLIYNLTSTSMMTFVRGKCTNHDFYSLQSCSPSCNVARHCCCRVVTDVCLYISVRRAPTPPPCPVGPPAPSWWDTPSRPWPGTRLWPALSTRLVTNNGLPTLSHFWLPFLLDRLATPAWTRGRGGRSTAPPWDMRRWVRLSVRTSHDVETFWIGRDSWKFVS